MNKELRLNLILGHLDKITAPMKKIRAGAGKTAEALKDNYRELNKLKKQQSQITSFKKLQGETRRSAEALNAQRYEVERLHKQLTNTKKPTVAMVRNFERAQKAAGRLEKQHQNNRGKLIGVQKAIKEAGGSTRKLADHEANLAKKLKTANGLLDQQKRKLDQVKSRQKALANIQEKYGNVRGRAGSLALQASVAGAGAGYLFKTQFLDVAAQFEDFEAVLRAVEGSSSKARQSMRWISDFSATTPYQLAEVTEAYKQLRAYGMEPTNGLLKTLGDTASAMNKPILQAVEAIADAVTGENERLKEFGIRAMVDGERITYQYTDRMGAQRSAIADKHNRAQIESTLKMIWNQKYSGAMKERSKTWRGMVSNLSDQWTRFSNMVMEAGLFDWMKNKLGGLLDKVNAMAADGRLQQYAKDVGQKMVTMATGIWAAVTAISAGINNIADFVGGWENLIYILAGIKLTGLIASIWSLVAAMTALNIAMAPMLAIAALVGAGVALYANRDKIMGLFGGSSPSKATPRRQVKTRQTAPLRAAAAGNNYTTQVEGIHIHPTPGMDAKEVAMEVDRQLTRRERQQAARSRSRLRDED